MSRPPGTKPLPPHEPVGAKAGLGLVVLLLLVALIVGGAWRYTRQAIADNAARRTLAELSAVLPADLYDNAPHRDVVLLDTGGGIPVPVYRARRGGVPVAAVLTVVAPDGYVGPVRLLVGLTADGHVLGVRVSSHLETPGIGSAVEESGWLGQFRGRSLGDSPESQWTVRNDRDEFDAIAGATTSSRAVAGGVRQALQYLAMNRDAIFAPPTPTGTP